MQLDTSQAELRRGQAALQGGALQPAAAAALEGGSERLAIAGPTEHGAPPAGGEGVPSPPDDSDHSDAGGSDGAVLSQPRGGSGNLALLSPANVIALQMAITDRERCGACARGLAGARLTSPRYIHQRRHDYAMLKETRMRRQAEQQQHKADLKQRQDVRHRGAARSRRAD